MSAHVSRLVAIFVMLLHGIALVHAQEDQAVTASLTWTSPPGAPCLDRTTLMSSVEARLARPVFVDENSADLHLSVAILVQDNHWVAELDLKDRRGVALGTRTVQAREQHCKSLADNLPLVVALLIDIPRRDLPPPATTNEPTALEDTTPTKQEIAPAQDGKVRAPVSPKLRHARGTLAITGDGNYGMLPKVALGGTLRGGIVTVRDWSVDLILSALGPSRVNPAGRGAADFSRFAVGTVGCMPVVNLTVSILGCAGADLGVLVAEGDGFDRSVSRTRLMPALSVGARARIPLNERLFALLDGTVAFPLLRERYVYRSESGGLATLHRSASAVPGLAIGLGLWVR